MLDGKAVITLAHNYMWNVDPRFVQRGMPGLVVGQYQATLPEFAGWTAIPNPVPIWEPAHTPGEKGSVVTICYTPSGRHERYPPGHRLYWHGKGYETTMRVLERLSRAMPLRLEVIGRQQLSHAEALAMKRRAHVVIDECVTGSYHRNSLEGLATGCVVVNGVGLLPGVVDTFRRCAADADRVPFVFATLDTLEAVLLDLANRGADSLTVMGRENRAWMERHWSFSSQWTRFWQPAIEAASATVTTGRPTPAAVRRAAVDEQLEVEVHTPALDGVSVVVPHGGYERLPLLTATLVMLRQRPGVGEVIVAEMGRTPAAGAVAAQWADKHLFIQHDGPFERARALNAGAAVAECELVMWLDNDLLIPPSFVVESVKELRNRRLDYLVPYSSIRYLSELDSDAVIRGERNPLDCHASNTFRSSGRSGAVTLGGIGLVRRDFLQRHGGLIEGFRGWGGEDNAWNQKVSLLGRSAPTERTDQTVHHLFHPMSGGYQMPAAMADNPHYAENVALLQRVFSVREQTQFMRQFPASAPAAGVLTRSHVVSGSNGRVVSGSNRLVVSGFSRTSDTPHELPVWTYWEGPCPEWIRACLRTITSHAARVHALDPKSFDQLWDRDRDINLSRLRPAHRADFVRAFLLHRYGGLWIDADCLVMHPLQPVLDLLQEHDFVGHRERAGLISNAFIAARRGSRIAGEFYSRVCHVLRSRKRLYWNALGADPLSAVVANDSRGWHELPCERVQPVCWSRPGEFFVERDHPDHDRVFDSQAVCYMLSNGAINNYIAAHRPPDLLSDRTFFSYLLRRSTPCTGATNGGASDPGIYERVFTANIELYRRQRSESLSGPGSCLTQTRELRERLPLTIESLKVRSILDAPCGDFNWMQHVGLGPVEYIGVDFMAEIVAENARRHESSSRRFLRADVLGDPLPRADLILCRDLLVHLTYADIARALRNFKASGATYLMATTFTKARQNLDTSGGEWRPLNLTDQPFNFPAPIRLVNEKCTEAGDTFDDKSLGIWRLADLPI
jgi:hypothetical protein